MGNDCCDQGYRSAQEKKRKEDGKALLFLSPGAVHGAVRYGWGVALIHPSHQSTGVFSPQLLTAGVVQTPHPHTSFCYSYVFLSGKSHSSRTQ